MLGPAIAKAGIDVFRVSAQVNGRHVRLTRAIVLSERDAERLRRWCVDGWHVPVVVEPGAIRVATAEERDQLERGL